MGGPPCRPRRAGAALGCSEHSHPLPWTLYPGRQTLYCVHFTDRKPEARGIRKVREGRDWLHCSLRCPQHLEWAWDTGVRHCRLREWLSGPKAQAPVCLTELSPWTHGRTGGRAGGNALKLHTEQPPLCPQDYAVQQWLQKGTPASKLVLGVPTYGRTFTLASPTDSGVGAPATGPGTPGPATKEAGLLAYYEVGPRGPARVSECGHRACAPHPMPVISGRSPAQPRRRWGQGSLGLSPPPPGSQGSWEGTPISSGFLEAGVPASRSTLSPQVCAWQGAAQHRIPDQQVPYASQGNQWVGFDDAQSFKAKVRPRPAEGPGWEWGLRNMSDQLTGTEPWEEPFRASGPQL